MNTKQGNKKAKPVTCKMKLKKVGNDDRSPSIKRNPFCWLLSHRKSSHLKHRHHKTDRSRAHNYQQSIKNQQMTVSADLLLLQHQLGRESSSPHHVITKIPNYFESDFINQMKEWGRGIYTARQTENLSPPMIKV